MNGIKVQIDKVLYKLGIADENGHISIFITLNKKGDDYRFSMNSKGIEGNYLKEWINKDIEPDALMKIKFTQIEETMNPYNTQEFSKSRNELLIAQYQLLKEKLKKKGLI